jgi:hypothetical protein
LEGKVRGCYLGIFKGGQKTKIHLRQDSRCPKRDSNQPPPEYKLTALPLSKPAQSIISCICFNFPLSLLVNFFPSVLFPPSSSVSPSLPLICLSLLLLPLLLLFLLLPYASFLAFSHRRLFVLFLLLEYSGEHICKLGAEQAKKAYRYTPQKKTNSVALVRKRTLPTERPPLVGEVSANFSEQRVSQSVSATNPHGR